MQGIKAIETTYAGCRFRSRLEARWAVLFDRLGIPWEYEPQGFQVSHRLTYELGTFPYLPDFWLPKEQVWVEVKGDLTPSETCRLLEAAASLSSNDGGGCHDLGGHDLVVCGPIPRPDEQMNTPTKLHLHKGELYASCFLCDGASCNTSGLGQWPGQWVGNLTIGRDDGYVHPHAAERLLQGSMCRRGHPGYGDLLAAARSARFEHGESGSR